MQFKYGLLSIIFLTTCIYADEKKLSPEEQDLINKALYLAIYRNNPEAVQKALKNKANANDKKLEAKSEYPYDLLVETSPLSEAITHHGCKAYEVVKILIANGANPHEKLVRVNTDSHKIESEQNPFEPLIQQKNKIVERIKEAQKTSFLESIFKTKDKKAQKILVTHLNEQLPCLIKRHTA
ncbi:MAG: hypothetical protein WA432_00465 [Candidatus Babeliaceae bacterium]